jgi:prepilin-type N-terminal cleavage/methylation domain-containing protein
MNKKAFTLVELIVVITIIAILGTIAFVSFQDYSSQARDTKTVSDLNNAHKKIALFKIETGFVPDPDNPVEVTSGVGNIISHQGEFGTNVKRILNYGETIVDPE